MKKMMKNKMLGLISCIMLVSMTGLAGCNNPAGGSTEGLLQLDPTEKKDPLDNPERTEKVMAYYNKMLGVWECEKDSNGTIINFVCNYYGTNIDEFKGMNYLHIEPKKWYWSHEGREDVVFQTWDEPFYKYIYLRDEWTAEDFKGDAGLIKNELNRCPSWAGNNDVIYLRVDKLCMKESEEALFYVQNDKITFPGLPCFSVVKSKGNDDKDKTGTDSKPGSSDINLDGTWNYAIDGQGNAGGTITFTNGKISFKHKVGSQTTEASYTVSGSDIFISYMTFDAEKFAMSSENNTLTLEYKGSGTSQVLLAFFQYIGGGNKIKFTK